MPKSSKFFFILLFILAVFLSDNGVFAFGAGNIPSFAFMEGKAFRHGDIDDALSDLIKRTGGGFALASVISKGSKFGGLDIKRVYFGNWLRDYSQAMDIAALKKVPQQTIINLLMVLGFLAHGYATNEFEVTPERLGVYLPVEHIDNPKGYGDGEDARKYHPKLRPPVDPRELEVDPRTGMKNYIANEQGHWDTSSAQVRRTLEQCIHLGRKHRSQGLKQDEYEAFRLLGTALHTLEDFSAHSNFCELVLVQMGYKDVFLHVGEQVRIHAPNGQWVAPIVTGTFGSNDFFHSLLGEAGDHISSATVTDLNEKVMRARSTASTQAQTRSGPGGSGPGDVLKGLLSSLPGGMGNEMVRDMNMMEQLRASTGVSGAQPRSNASGGGYGGISGGGYSSGYGAPDGGYGVPSAPQVPPGSQHLPGGGKNPEQMSPQELHSVLWSVLSWRDSVVKKISKTIEKIPGLGAILEKITDSIAVFVLTTLDPFLKPILQSTTNGLQAASGEIINTHNQYEVFNDPRASDPTHSFLSKDHFSLILNEPAGLIAKVIVSNTVNLVTKAWEDNAINVHQVIGEILQCLFHPDFHNQQSKVQREMLQCMRDWANRLGPRQQQIIHRLSKQSVRNHENIRISGNGETWAPDSHWNPVSHSSSAYSQQSHGGTAGGGLMGKIPGIGQVQQMFGGQGFGTGRDVPAPSGPPQTTYAPPAGPPHVAPPHGHASHTHTGYYPSAGPPSTGPSPFPNMYPSAPTSPTSPQNQHGGFSSGYTPSYSSPPPSFPGSGPAGFPEPGYGNNTSGGYGFPAGHAAAAAGGYPGAVHLQAPGFPSANAPSFGEHGQHGQHGQYSQHGQHHQGHGHGQGRYGGGW